MICLHPKSYEPALAANREGKGEYRKNSREKKILVLLQKRKTHPAFRRRLKKEEERAGT